MQLLFGAVDDLRAQGADEALLEPLLRGIAVHHAGMHKRYRQAVEMLFRSKHLQVGQQQPAGGAAAASSFMLVQLAGGLLQRRERACAIAAAATCSPC